MTFQVVHQASELLMKGVAWELDRARRLIADGDFFNSAQLLRRGNHMLEYPISMLHELETITPYDYHLIRAGLGHGSGLDSPGFLALLHIGPRLGEAFNAQLSKAASPWTICIAVTRNSSACMTSPSVCSILTNACTCSAFIT